MKFLELFSGTCRMSDIFIENGCKVLSVDIEGRARLKKDVCILKPEEVIYHLGGRPNIIWASPPCTAFSVASISKNWSDGVPKSGNAYYGIEMLMHTLRLINQLQPKYWYIENPRGMMRKLPIMKSLHRITFTFCQYGDKVMKPTDIWTNDIHFYLKSCKPNMVCHEKSPRGSKLGTQGKKNSQERGALPYDFCKIFFENAIKKVVKDE